MRYEKQDGRVSQAVNRVQALRSRPHVIQLGFNKTGTSSLGRLFKSNNYTVGSVRLAKLIKKNIDQKIAPYSGMESIDLFQDVENHKKCIYIYEYFETIFENYPESYYILTTRSCESWIKSRMLHKQGNYARIALEHKGISSLSELRDIWRSEFYEYHLKVNTFFNKRKNFFTLSLENINYKALQDFLKRDYTFKQSTYPKVLTGKAAPPRGVILPDTKSFVRINYS